MKKAVLSKRETSILKDLIRAKWPFGAQNFEGEKNFICYELEKGRRIVSNKAFIAIQTDSETIVPFLGTGQILTAFPSVVVDMGAVKFVCNGARVTRPGIMKFDTFNKGDLVTVKDEKYSKVLAVGRALEDSNTAINNNKGYVIDNIHYIGDDFWESYKEINPLEMREQN
ncbi:MAG TPA: PUA domain-containing protein [Nitrososphaeraceae archaeon]|jgi:PUA domain protein|nr:PUA domain-containing protein [Nitrososphaeraceae archaeon]